MCGCAETLATGSTIMPEDLIARVMSESTTMQSAGHGGSAICEQEKAELQKRILEQDRQITKLCKELAKLCKEVAFLRLGFTRLPQTRQEAAGFYDWTVFGGSGDYSRGVHFCVLASKSVVMKAEIQAHQAQSASHRYLSLPNIRYGFERIGGTQCESTVASGIYDAFIDYFYTASVSTSNLQGMFADLLFLALKYDVADLRDDCLQYVQENDNIIWDHPKHFTAFLSLGVRVQLKAYHHLCVTPGQAPFQVS